LSGTEDKILIKIGKLIRRKERLLSLLDDVEGVCDQDITQYLIKKLFSIETKVFSLSEEYTYQKSSQAYTIFGGLDGAKMRFKYYDIVSYYATLDGIEESTSGFPYEVVRDIINDKCYDKLVKFASLQDEALQNSHLAYIILGVFLMQFGANISIELRDTLLKYSNNNLFFSEKDLNIFKEKLLNYKNGEKIEFPFISFNKKSDWKENESSSLYN
jgi:hypothetical protein